MMERLNPTKYSEINRGLLIIRRQRAAFCELLHVAEHLFKKQVISLHLPLPRCIVRLRRAVPNQRVIERTAVRSERTRFYRSVIHGIETGGTQGLGVCVAVPRLPDND